MEEKALKEEEYKKFPYWDQSLDIEKRIDDLFNRLTFEEKCKLCAGEKNNSPPAIERLGIPLFSMTDGPHGVSPYRSGVGPNGAQIPPEGNGTSTYFPTGIQLASTWNPELIYHFGAALAEETRAVGRCMQLGPAMNICRSPMNGRTFEYYSEDPVLSGEMGAATVKGMQSKKIAPCVKHFVANNFESNRFKVNAVISRRALEEIYFSNYKRCIKKADPWGIMSSYNKINGIYVSEHKEILRNNLKDKWGFSGIVVSDWGATRLTTGIKSLVEAGLDIEMGSRNIYQIEEMIRMKEAGEFPEEYFDDNTKRILKTMFRVGLFDDPSTLPEGKINTPEHQALSRKLAEEGMVLLKNEKNILPLDINKIKKIAVIGKHADLKFGRSKLGGGSSAVLPPYEITIRDGIKNKCEGKIEIVEDPSDADVAVVCVGLEHTHDFKGGDHEGGDRMRYDLGFLLPKMVNSVVRKNPNTIVVCVNGSPFGMEKFEKNVPAILEAWYGGMEIGNAVADILFGDINPSGKLPVSWPKGKEDIKTALSLWDTIIPVKEVIYDEGVFVGYRYYDTNNVDLRYCFGHGLSYTNFEYSNLRLSASEISGDESLTISFDIKNTGDRNGAEITQLYIHDSEASILRPKKELKGFKKEFLKQGESKSISFNITKEDLSFFDGKSDKWIAEDGEFEILIGASIDDIRLNTKFQFKN